MSIVERLEEVFHSVFNDESIKITEQTTSEDVQGWDSVAHINLMLSVEQAFSVHFASTELSGFNNVGELVSILERKGVS